MNPPVKEVHQREERQEVKVELSDYMTCQYMDIT